MEAQVIKLFQHQQDALTVAADRNRVAYYHDMKEGDAMNLYQHQQDALEQTKHLNRVAFYHDMGL